MADDVRHRHHAGLYLTGGLDEELRARCNLSLAEQDLLSQVGKAGGGLRMSELAERLFSLGRG